jgi:hypothetical protein
LCHTAVNVVLLHFEVRDAVSEQTTDSVITFVDCNGVTSSCELLCSGQSCWARTNYRNGFAGQSLGNRRGNKTIVESIVNDRDFNLLDCHRWLIDSQHASTFAWCGAKATGEFRKVVGGVQAVNRFTIASPVS